MKSSCIQSLVWSTLQERHHLVPTAETISACLKLAAVSAMHSLRVYPSFHPCDGWDRHQSSENQAS